MAEIFVISDTHFSHAAIIFKFRVGCTCRPWDGVHAVDCASKPMREFASVEEMDETIIDNWNACVRPQDKVYHLGDVAMDKKAVKLVGRCHGHKRLVRGNHDTHDDKHYRPFFEAIYGSRLLDRELFLTHIPIHPVSLRYDWVNVHGHVHNNVDKHHFGPRYHNVSIEVTDYRPLTLGELKARITAQQQENRAIAEQHLASIGVKRLWTDEELMRERP